MRPTKQPRDPLRLITPRHPAFKLWLEREAIRSPKYYDEVLRHRKFIRLHQSQINEIMSRRDLIENARRSAGKD